MNIAQAKQQVKDTVEAYLATDEAGLFRIPTSRQRPLFLVGAPGIGKTAIMAQVAHELEVGLVSYSMTHHTRQSALGLPFIVHREYPEGAFDVSEYTMSEIIASVHDYMERTGLTRGILFLDEINCVSETLYPSMLQFLQFKTFGRHKVPDGWVVVTAGNPPEYNKSVHEFDIVTLDRLRKIEVEPDYGAWKAYAAQSGVHPAIVSYLEIKPGNFYEVESTPSGKRFVTARGWDDLSEIVTLFESLGKPIDRQLVSQFLQSPDIAEDFAVYYELFDKYRSDYQIDDILAGRANDEIIERAQNAAFDERLALVSLVIDALSSAAARALDREAATVKVRDVLRDAKPELLDGALVRDALEARIEQRVSSLARKRDAGTSDARSVRIETAAIDVLKQLVASCRLSRTMKGQEAFEEINAGYRAFVGELDPLVDAVSTKIDCAFSFMEQTFGDGREMVVFATEMTARRDLAHFVNRFGSESYYAHNDRLQVSEHRHALTSRIADFGIGDGAPAVKTVASAPATAAAGVAVHGALGGSASASAHEPVSASSAEASEKTCVTLSGIDRDCLERHYADAAFEYGFASLCKMTLPDDLVGKTVLDIGCRRGKGVFKISSRVGSTGRAIGLEWSPAFYQEACERMERAWRDNGLARNNMEFLFGYPEDLAGAGVSADSVDVVVVNSSINLAYDLEAVYREIFRVLAPGGLLVSEAVIAGDAREPRVVEQARALGNSVQAAPSRHTLESILSKVGYEVATYFDLHEVSPTAGYTQGHEVEAAPSNERVTFYAGVMHTRKPERAALAEHVRGNVAIYDPDGRKSI